MVLSITNGHSKRYAIKIIQESIGYFNYVTEQ